MDTSAGYYQAPRPPRVPLDEVLIKLHPEGFHQSFDADGINVGAGGLSMRASVLPQVGSTLRCQLDNPAGGEAIEMIGRVVWAHESGEHAGEFGIRFTQLSTADQTRIEALIQRWGRSTAKAPTVRLQLAGVDSAIEAELQSESDEALTVEQSLPFLAIGSKMVNETTGRRGHLEAVELRINEQTPRLVLSIGYEAIASEVGSEDGGRDTMPDEPPLIRASRPSDEVRLHDTPQIVRYDKAEEDASKTTLVDRLQAYAKAARDQAVDSVASARSTMTERVVPGARGRLKEFFALLARFVGALRARLDEKPRRKQVPRSRAARAHLKNTRRSHRRAVVLAAVVAVIVAAGWGIYLWAVEGATSTTETDSGADTAAAAGSGAAAESAAAAETAETAAESETRSEAKAGAGAEAGLVSASTPESQSEAEVVEAPGVPERVRGEAFGAESVPGGETYVLRMSNPVTEMEGIVEQDGFSVTIPGSLSLSRAGPIASAHPDVEHASILNRGELSELTVRFVAGRKPLYRVEARGPAVAITVAR